MITLIAELNYRAYWHVISYFREDNFLSHPDNIFPMPLELNMICLPAESEQSPHGLPPVANPQQWLPEDLGADEASVHALLKAAESFG
ncbi:MAG: hypothetical protein HOM25_19485 [Rhodospirillaceae bacterium]|nr:hypothetical protein [Rhodospirillaceae bacterium]